LYLLTAIAMHGSTEEFRQLDAELFVDDEEVGYYDFVKNYFRRYGEFPAIDVLENETNVTVPQINAPIQYYKDRVHNRRMYNAVREHFGTLRTALSDMDMEDLRDAVSDLTHAVRVYAPDHSVLTISDVLAEVLADYDRHHASPGYSGVSTGWDTLNAQTGGYQNGDLIVWVARPSMGKTWLLIHQTRAAWLTGKSVLFVSMEMTLPQIGSRFAAYHAGLNHDYVRKGALSLHAERRFRTSLRRVENANNFTLYAGGMKKRAEEIDILIQELSPDAVYVDGIYLMQPANARKNIGRYEAAAYLVDELKTIAYVRNRPIICTTQFGRDAGKGGHAGSLENIGYTDAFSTHSSLIFGIKGGKKVQRPQRGGRRSDDDIINNREVVGTVTEYPYRVIETLKGREGESGDWGIKYTFSPPSFAQVPIAEATPQDSDIENEIADARANASMI